MNTVVECIIAISTASGVAGLTAWKNDWGSQIWPIVAGAAAILAATKPFLMFGKKMTEYSKLYAGHLSNYFELEDLTGEIAVKRKFDREMERRFDRIKKRYIELELQGVATPSRARVAKLQGEVNKEIPPETLWCPPDDGDHDE